MASIKYQNTGNIIRDSTVHQQTITGGTHFYRDYTAIYLKNEKMMIFINVTWLFLWLLGKIYNALFWHGIDYILNSYTISYPEKRSKQSEDEICKLSYISTHLYFYCDRI